MSGGGGRLGGVGIGSKEHTRELRFGVFFPVERSCEGVCVCVCVTVVEREI